MATDVDADRKHSLVGGAAPIPGTVDENNGIEAGDSELLGKVISVSNHSIFLEKWPRR